MRLKCLQEREWWLHSLIASSRWKDPNIIILAAYIWIYNFVSQFPYHPISAHLSQKTESLHSSFGPLSPDYLQRYTAGMHLYVPFLPWLPLQSSFYPFSRSRVSESLYRTQWAPSVVPSIFSFFCHFPLDRWRKHSLLLCFTWLLLKGMTNPFTLHHEQGTSIRPQMAIGDLCASTNHINCQVK